MQYNYNNIAMMNQLYRQKENIENMINQYSQNVAQPPKMLNLVAGQGMKIFAL